MSPRLAASSRPSSSRRRRTSSTSGPRSSRRSASARSCGSRARAGERYLGVRCVTDGFAYSDLASAAARCDRRRRRSRPAPADDAHRPHRDPAVHRRRAAPGARGAAPAGADGRRVHGHRRRRGHRAADGWLLASRAFHRHPDRRCTPPRGLESPVYLDADFLLGPEAAHLNITGVSGLATKTSAVEFLLASIFQTFPEAKGSIAAVCFNVKGPDLCFLDQPGALDDADRAALRAAGPACRSRSARCATSRPTRPTASTSTRCGPTPRSPRTSSRWSGACAKSSTTPRCCSTATTSTPRPTRSSTSSRSAWSARDVRRRELRRRPVPRAESFADLERLLPRDLRLHGGDGARQRRLAHAPRRHDPQGAQPAWATSAPGLAAW